MAEDSKYKIFNAVQNNVLAYISCARETMTQEAIIKNTVAFYEKNDIVLAKELCFKISGGVGKPVARYACRSNPNPLVVDVSDILSYFDKAEENEVEMPKFLGSGLNAMPPSNFEHLADILCGIRDENTAFRVEMAQLREIVKIDAKAMEDICTVKQEVSDIKKIVMKNNIPSGPKIDKTEPTSSETFQTSYSVAAGKPTKPTAAPAVKPKTTPADAKDLMETPNNKEQPWTKIQRGRRNSGGNGQARSSVKRRNANICGMKTSNDLVGVERVMDIFLGGCSKDTTCEMIKAYCSTNKMVIKKVEALQTKSEWYQPFKISLGAAERDRLLDAELWPKDCFVRKYFKARVNDQRD